MMLYKQKASLFLCELNHCLPENSFNNSTIQVTGNCALWSAAQKDLKKVICTELYKVTKKRQWKGKWAERRCVFSRVSLRTENKCKRKIINWLCVRAQVKEKRCNRQFNNPVGKKIRREGCRRKVVSMWNQNLGIYILNNLWLSSLQDRPCG